MTDQVQKVVIGEKVIVKVASTMPGPPGPPGPTASPSADAGNRLALGTDGGLYVPEWTGTDPVAYYFLARS